MMVIDFLKAKEKKENKRQIENDGQLAIEPANEKPNFPFLSILDDALGYAVGEGHAKSGIIFLLSNEPGASKVISSRFSKEDIEECLNYLQTLKKNLG